MENLPSHLCDEILFRLNHRSLARIKCVNRAFRSKISPGFETEYFSRLTGLIHGPGACSGSLHYVPFVSGDAKARAAAPPPLMRCQILGSDSGLVLLFVDDELCVLNPITKAFRFLGQKRSLLELSLCFIRYKRSMRIGFAVDKIDRTTQRFRVVTINVQPTLDPGSSYGFEIYDGDGGSWRASETTITCPTSKLFMRVKPVYFRGALHWLRNDGSVVAFDPETEEARLIPTTFRSPDLTGLSVWLGAVDGDLTLVSATEEVISVFVLRDGPSPVWVLEKQISNDALEKGKWLFWTVAAYDGRFLVVQETKSESNIRLLHGYDVVGAKKWRVIGTLPTWTYVDRDFFGFEPSWLAVRGLEPRRSTFRWSQPLGLFMQMIDP